MQTLNSFANHVGGLTTQAVQARTHRFGSCNFGVTCWHVSAKVSKFLFSNPALLSTRRGYPNSAFATSVNNGQAPLGFQIKNVTIGNHFSSQRINDFNRVNSQNEFGFNPKNINKRTENDTEQQVAHDLNIVTINPQAVGGKERNQYIRSRRPSEVTAGSKGFIHHLSIAGERK